MSDVSRKLQILEDQLSDGLMPHEQRGVTNAEIVDALRLAQGEIESLQAQLVEAQSEANWMRESLEFLLSRIKNDDGEYIEFWGTPAPPVREIEETLNAQQSRGE